jgi:hypothetical protein
MNLQLEILACWLAVVFGLICSLLSYRDGNVLFSKLFAIVVVGAIVEIVYLFIKTKREKNDQPGRR